jgi:hypothetical protein
VLDVEHGAGLSHGTLPALHKVRRDRFSTDSSCITTPWRRTPATQAQFTGSHSSNITFGVVHECLTRGEGSWPKGSGKILAFPENSTQAASNTSVAICGRIMSSHSCRFPHYVRAHLLIPYRLTACSRDVRNGDEEVTVSEGLLRLLLESQSSGPRCVSGLVIAPMASGACEFRSHAPIYVAHGRVVPLCIPPVRRKKPHSSFVPLGIRHTERAVPFSIWIGPHLE